MFTDRYTRHYHRHYAHPIELVWEAVSTSEHLDGWLLATTRVEHHSFTPGAEIEPSNEYLGSDQPAGPDTPRPTARITSTSWWLGAPTLNTRAWSAFTVITSGSIARRRDGPMSSGGVGRRIPRCTEEGSPRESGARDDRQGRCAALPEEIHSVRTTRSLVSRP